ncbi:MAG: hypothetical protein WCB79_10880, partial [Halobacteriota archaeon]
DRSTLFDGDLPRVVGGSPVDDVHGSFESVSQEVGNGVLTMVSVMIEWLTSENCYSVCANAQDLTK